MPPSSRARAFAVVAAGMLGCLSAGSVYAWSLFYAPIEQDLGIGRTWLSGSFSIAGILFAAAMMISPLVFRGRPSSWLLLLSGILCGAGMAVPGVVRELWCIVLFVGAVFGIGAGIGYAVALQAIMLAMPHRRGLGAGLMASAGAMGSVLGAVGFRAAIEAWGPWVSLMAGGGVLFACAGIASLLLVGVRMARPAPRAAMDKKDSRRERRIEITFWLGFFFGACAGLMALGHAAGIALAIGGPLAPVALATALITVANGVGRLGAGALADLLPARRILVAAPILAAVALASLAVAPSTSLALLVLTVTGFAYGAIASTYPAAVAIYFGIERTGIVFGRVFTAWGVASLLAPGLGGYLFDATGNYAAALAIAACAGLVSAATAATIPPPHR